MSAADVHAERLHLWGPLRQNSVDTVSVNKNIPFAQALALQSSSRNCYPAPDLVLFKWILHVSSSLEECFLLQTPVGCPWEISTLPIKTQPWVEASRNPRLRCGRRPYGALRIHVTRQTKLCFAWSYVIIGWTTVHCAPQNMRTYVEAMWKRNCCSGYLFVTHCIWYLVNTAFV